MVTEFILKIKLQLKFYSCLYFSLGKNLLHTSVYAHKC